MDLFFYFFVFLLIFFCRLQLDQCVVVVNFTSIDRNRTSVYSIPEFFEKAIKEEPYLFKI